MKKNRLLRVRVDSNLMNLLQEASSQTGLSQCELARLLLARSLKELKGTAIKHGWDNLKFEIVPF